MQAKYPASTTHSAHIPPEQSVCAIHSVWSASVRHVANRPTADASVLMGGMPVSAPAAIIAPKHSAAALFRRQFGRISGSVLPFGDLGQGQSRQSHRRASADQSPLGVGGRRSGFSPVSREGRRRLSQAAEHKRRGLTTLSIRASLGSIAANDRNAPQDAQGKRESGQARQFLSRRGTANVLAKECHRSKRAASAY